MTDADFLIHPETRADRPAIETLLDAAFGLDRRTKTAYRLREGSSPVEGLCLTARLDGRIVGSIEFWPLVIGEGGQALLLGPLAVDPGMQGRGCGMALMKRGIALAREQGHGLIVLVGDEPYYARVGFARVPDGRFIMPGFVDPDRLLALELRPGALSRCSGLVQNPVRVSAALAIPGQAEQAEQRQYDEKA